MDEEKVEKTAKSKPRKINKLVFGIVMFLLGAFTIFIIRFATYVSDDVHYHANFNLFINGTKDEFKNFTFYKEVAACDVHDKEDVEARVHMHNENSSLIHVHAQGVTWGQFFANLGYTLGNEALTTDDGTFVDGQDGKSLSFLLNGESTSSVQNKLIESKDVLLINFGSESKEILEERFNEIPKDAVVANTTADPAACSGSEDSSITKRLKSSLGIKTH